MKKICSVVGARPQFIKLAVVSRVLRRETEFQEVLIHTGQHFDHNMSGAFFDELEIPDPDYNLGVSGGTHGDMTGRMLIRLEETFLQEKPDMALLFGDTNSTLAAALAAVKLQIPVCHVEAGNRQGGLSNPEEVNRIVTDHVSSLHMACTPICADFLRREGFTDSVFLSGDPMYDAFLSLRSDKGEALEIQSIQGGALTVPAEFYYMTCHRQENTDDSEKLRQIFEAMERLDAPVIYPVHPRNRERAVWLIEQYHYRNILLAEPVSYRTSIALVKHAKKIITDSGGLQREAFFAKKPCVSVMNTTPWPETLTGGCNRLACPDQADILEKLEGPAVFDPDYQPFGDGHSAEKIVGRIREFLL